MTLRVGSLFYVSFIYLLRYLFTDIMGLFWITFMYRTNVK